MIGQIVGNYKIVKNIGEGGVGMVYQGVDTMLDREVAIKILRPELASQTSVVERFRSEAVTLAKLSHPNIATLYALIRQGDELYMVMEFVRGESLAQILHRRRALSSEEAIPIFCQALDGINHAHELGIVHRDIKPGNMILTANNVLKVLDFGIARLLKSARMTRIGNIIGTLEYMSPEQVRGQETDARSDIYALGIMLYEILTGRLPFESDNEFVLMKAQTEETPALPRIVNPSIPSEVEAAIMRAVAKNPDERFQTAGEFMETLLDAGFSLDPNAFGFKSILHGRISRPSNPGIGRIEQSAPPPFKNAASKTEAAPLPIAAEKSEEKATLLQFSENESKETRLSESLQTPKAVEPAKENPSSAEIKATRFDENAAAAAMHHSTNSVEIKATRLETPIETADFDAAPKSAPSQPPSFFSRLTWVHFAGAGAAIVVLFGIAALAVVVPLLFIGTRGVAPAANPKPVENRLVEEKSITVEPATKPSVVPTPIEQFAAQAVEEETPAPSTPQPLEQNPVQPVATPQPEPLETVEPQPVNPAEQQPPPAAKQPRAEPVRKEPTQKPKTVTPKPPPPKNPGGSATNKRPTAITVN